MHGGDIFLLVCFTFSCNIGNENGKSNIAVLKNILAEAEKSKRAGTLSNEEIETFYQNFAPMLNGFQRRQLRSIVDKLKKIE